jgi:thiamine biosynthesis lipoprotein
MWPSDSNDHRVTRRNVIIFSSLLLGSLAILLTLLLIRTKDQYYELRDFALGTSVRIVVSSQKINPRTIAEAILEDMKRITYKFSFTDERSVVKKINDHPDEWVEVDEETYSLIKAACAFAELTDGAFDPTVGRLLELWRFTGNYENLRVPSREEIEEALKHIGYKNVLFDDKNMRVMVKNGVKIDLGGIAKGYALDRARQIALSFDENATGFVEAGGDIRIIGPKFGKYPWVIGVKDPREDNVIDYIYLKSGAVATSGDYERYFVVDGVRYHHILDPSTGYPARGVWSVTIVAEDATTADALSTAGFVMAGKDWRKVVLDFPNMGAHPLIVLEGGTIEKSETFKLFERE